MRSAGATTPRGFLGRVRFAILYAGYVGLWFVAVHYLFFWRPFVDELREREKPRDEAPSTTPYVDAVTARRLGNFGWPRKPSFADAASQKPPGTERVCTFGDSFTHGDEVPAGYDYPSFLRQELARRGFENVEVINFGAPWFGFHQVYLLWEAAGTQLDCDWVLLGPRCFQYNRDTTFNHSEMLAPYYLHARFVLDGDGVRLAEVPGETYAERFAAYASFFPRWQYLRYDRNPPPTLLAALPRNHTLPNPLYYYSGSMEEEALATYRVLLRQLGEKARRVVVLHDFKRVVETAATTGLPNVVAARVYMAKRFPYRAPAGHYSAFGNQMVAGQYLAQIAEPADERLTIIETADPRPSTAGNAESPQLLSSFGSIEVRLADRGVAWLIVATRHAARPGSVSPSSLKDTNVAGLFAIKARATNSWLDAFYSPVEFAMRSGTEVVAAFENPAGAPPVSLGRLRLLDPRLNIGALDLDGLEVEATAGKVFLKTGRFGARAGSRLTIRIGERAVLRGTVGPQSVEISPLAGEFRSFRPIESHFADVSTLPPNGTFELVLEHPERGTLRTPIGVWRKVGVPMPRPAHPFTDRLRRTAGG